MIPRQERDVPTSPVPPAVVHAFMPYPDPVAVLSPQGSILRTNIAWSNRFPGATVLPKSLLSLPEVEGEHLVTLQSTTGDALALHVWAVRMPDQVLLIAHGADGAMGDDLLAQAEQLRRRVQELELLSATDHLTGAWNRAHFDRTIAVELNRSRESRRPLSLVLLDIDHFKHVNDTHGHGVGDEVLRELVRVVQGRLRAADNLFRWGGEEFAVLVSAAGYRGAERLAEDLRQTVAGHRFAEAGAVTASLGVAEHLGDEDADGWFTRLDHALYAAKDGGRNRVVVDRHGDSDLWAAATGVSALRLVWQEAYECGEPTIDEEHRQLFTLANVLIDALTAGESGSLAFCDDLNALLAHVQRHFSDEEAILARMHYADLAAHQRAHAGLLKRALQLKEQALAGHASLGPVVEFLAQDVVARHLMVSDRAFFPLFERGAVAEPAVRPTSR